MTRENPPIARDTDTSTPTFGGARTGKSMSPSRRESAAIAIRNRVLKNVAEAAPQQKSLDDLTTGFEKICPGSMCSVLLLNGDRLRHASAPTLPKEYTDAIDGLQIGVGVGTCGTAAATGRLCVVEDISAHPFWSDFMGLAEVAGIQSCWSTPIHGSDESVLGTFAVYYCHPRQPEHWEVELVSTLAQIAGVAIEKHRDRQSLSQARTHLEFLCSASPAVFYSCEPQGDCPTTFISDNIRSQLDHHPSEYLNNPKCWEEHLHPDDRDRVLATHRQLEDVDQVDIEYRYRHGDGHYVWLHDRQRLIHDSDGNIISLVGCWLDVSERHDAEVRIRENESQLQSILDNSSFVIFLKDLNRKLIRVNRQFEKMLGQGQASLVGKTDDELFSIECVNAFADTDNLALASPGAIECEETVRIGNEDRVFLTTKTALRHEDGTPYAICGMATDISARKRRDELFKRFAQSVSPLNGADFFESLVRLIAEFTGVSHVMIGKVCNDEATAVQSIAISEHGRYAGAIRYDLKGTPCKQVVSRRQCVYPERVADFFPQDRLLVELEIESYAGLALADSAGVPLGLLVVMDTSPMPQCEDLMKILEVFAARATAELERDKLELERAKLEAQLRRSHRMEAIGTFSAGIAHDFNNILTAITGYTELLQSTTLKQSQIQEALEGLTLATQQGAGITQSLLTFSQKASVDREDADFRKIIGEAVMTVRRLIPSSIALQFESRSDAPIYVQANSTQLQQVLLNLCLNARNAMPKGGWIKIDIEQASAEDREVVLTVRDNGEGIPQDALEHIFEPFFTLRPRGQGTGLGMAVVHGIVTDHDGVIDIESEIGEGTCVTVTLPSLSPEYVRQSQTCLPTPTINSMGRVLVVEDNDQIRRLQEIALANKGHTVYAFKYGKRAIEFVHEDGGEFDAIVLDDDLSDMTGTECLKEIKSRQPCIQSVYATGSANFVPPTSDAERGIVIRKPFQMADLADRISELIADRRSQSESL